MTTVLVTGVAGFIGSNLAQALLNRNYRVIGIDNLSQGYRRNIAAFSDHPSFEFHAIDVRDGPLLDPLAARADVIIHLAAFKIPRYGHALDTLQVNTHGMRNILTTAAKNGTRVVFASTSDVYGRNPDLPFHEGSDLWMGPSTVKRWAYAVSKIFDEHLCFAFQEEAALPVTILRLFGGYGPNQNLTWWGGPQSVFITAALRGEPMEIHGNGRQTRSFTYVSDIVEGIIRCTEDKHAVGEVFNIGSTEEIAIIDLASLIWELAGKGEPRFTMVSYRTFGKYEDVVRRIPDPGKAQRLLGFAPDVRLRDGLQKTIAWQRKLLAEDPAAAGGGE
ncbi:MAG: GDP-mannose 4,6-dehydratase [Methanomicrobiales archaeon]|nr:GDP-mannose 4,6-dehydratase [Methanomicrobiales archaeon]